MVRAAIDLTPTTTPIKPPTLRDTSIARLDYYLHGRELGSETSASVESLSDEEMPDTPDV